MEQKDVDVVKVDTNEDSSNTEKAPLDTEQPSVRYIYSFLCLVNLLKYFQNGAMLIFEGIPYHLHPM